MSARSLVFADALDGSTDDRLDDTDDLLRVVVRLRELPGSATTLLADAGARPDFRAALRTRLLDEAAQQGPADATVVSIESRWTRSWSQRNRAALLTSAAAAVVVVAGTSVTASHALPGSPFYPLKRGAESVQYSLAGSDESRGTLELGFARTRLHEIDRITAHDAAFGIAPSTGPQAAGVSPAQAATASPTVVRLLADMNREAAKGSVLLARSFRDHPRPGPMQRVQQFARFQEARLTVLRGRLAGPALTSATKSIVWAQQLVTQTSDLLSVCSAKTCPQSTVSKLVGPIDPNAAPGSPPQPPTTGKPVATPAPQPSPIPTPPVTVAPQNTINTAIPPLILPPVTNPGSPAVTTTPGTTPATPTDNPPTSTDSSTSTDGSSTSSSTPSSSPSGDLTTSEPPPTSEQPPPSSEPPPTSPVPPPTSPVPPQPSSGPPPTSEAPPPTSAVEPTTQPPATTPDPIITSNEPSASAPPTSAAQQPQAPAESTTPTETGFVRPPLICLLPRHILNGACVRGSVPPGAG